MDGKRIPTAMVAMIKMLMSVAMGVMATTIAIAMVMARLIAIMQTMLIGMMLNDRDDDDGDGGTTAADASLFDYEDVCVIAIMIDATSMIAILVKLMITTRMLAVIALTIPMTTTITR